VLDLTISQFLAGELDAAGAAKAVEKGWEDLTDQFGRDKQKAAYQATLGVKK